ncbi:DUF898 domain-containing protein [Enterovibrio sp. ZSDZ35]|uniref:DUF898 domain-containing protein n=1 Tax=Enterovibrio qingdaonensis TaxID=2899818 RepID=A0ABT5QL54_9GAMM|nr:YjgN family protein [Enterovibrio sp. ZSDZ35]MDD1781712.1 DUF898 domain-containing protein [Enterovibrio sp. ZSDZ35]
MENKMIFHGSGREYFGIWIVNVVLSILTLGIYSAWAKVRTKKYFYGNTELAGDRFEYHATPKQILIGRIIAVTAFVIWFAVGHFYPLFSSVLFVIGLLLMPWVVRNNARFNAKMSSYRNVRLNFTGTLLGAYGVMLGRGLLVFLAIVTSVMLSSAPGIGGAGFVIGLGGAIVVFLLFCWMMMGISSYFANGHGYGKLTFSAALRIGYFVRTYLWAILIYVLCMVGFVAIMFLMIGLAESFMDPTKLELLNSLSLDTISFEHLASLFGMVTFFLFIYGMFFVAILIVSSFIACRVRNYVFGLMMVGESGDYRLGSTMNTASYTMLIVTNFLMQVFTLGFARPWVKVRTAKYLLSVTTVYGDLDALRAFDDDDSMKSAIGDEVSQAFDLDIGLG